jgi:cyanophycinase
MDGALLPNPVSGSSKYRLRRYLTLVRALLTPSQWAGGFVVGLTLGVVAWGLWAFRPDDEPEFLERFRGGTLVIAGGGDLPAIVNQRFWELAGGKRARLVIIPAYDATKDDISRLKLEWKRWPFHSVTVLQAVERSIAENPDFANPILNADAVWLSGGDQSWLADLYADTPVETQLQALLDRGGIIGGTSAGASIMTRVMIEEGQRHAKLNRGLDLLKDSVVDQHFFHRNRPQRLIGAVKEQPHLIGFGVDEGTALVVNLPNGRLRVIGKSYVMACIAGDQDEATRLEILKPGDSIFLDRLRSPIDRP